MKWYCKIEKTKRGWSILNKNEVGGGSFSGTSNLARAISECLDTNKLEECLPDYIEIKGLRYTPQEAVKKFMKRGFWYDRIYQQFKVL